jgi:hypothetical protein
LFGSELEEALGGGRISESRKIGLVSWAGMTCLFAVCRSAPCQKNPDLSGILKESAEEADSVNLPLEFQAVDEEVEPGELEYH